MGIDPASLPQGVKLAMLRAPVLKAPQRPFLATPKPVETVLIENQGKAAEGVHFTIPGTPIGKPRQTRADKWRKRPCVLRYREWADKARAAAPELPKEPLEVHMTAYFPFPASYSAKKRAKLKGQHHRLKPDADNVLKAVCDALFDEDSCIAVMSAVKRWYDGVGARVEVVVK